MQDRRMKCFDDETQKRKGLSVQCVCAFVYVCMCAKEKGAEREEKEGCMEKVVPGPRPKQLILFKRMKEGRVLEVEGTANVK